MKKILLTAATFAVAAANAFAQPELTANGVYDDFSTYPEYNDPETGRGIYWWGSKGVNSVTRDTANNQVLVKATQGEYQYVPFGVSFGDDNGALPGGVPNTIDLSQNGVWSFDVTNYGTESIYLRVAAQDNQNRILDCTPIPNPNNLPFDNLDVWKYQVQMLIPAGKTLTFKAGTPNGAGGGKLNNCDFANSVWGDYGTIGWDPVTKTHPGAAVRTDCDITKIASISFTPMNALKKAGDGHSYALTAGNFGISNLRVGTVSKPLGIEEDLVKYGFALYPNPAKNSLTIKNNSTKIAEAISIINNLGQKVYSNTITLSNNELTIDTNGFAPGVYIVKIGNNSQKLIIE